MKILGILFIILIGTSLACEDRESRVLELKDFNNSYPFPCSYSGLIPTNPEVNGNIFYWFFPTENQTEDTKLVLWFSGGPGGSGIGSMYEENGPIKFRMNDGKFEVYSDIENSFSDIANVIYIDQPFGVGYSYSDTDVTTGEEVGQVVLSFMQKFYELYPEQKELDLIIAGNSYAGHFMPNAVNSIIDFNESTEDESSKIPIYGLLVEDGYIDPITQRLSIKTLALGTGLLTIDLLDEYEALENRCEQSIFLDPDNAFSRCKEMNSLLSETDGNWEIMDVRTRAGEPDLGGYLNDEYFNTPTVRFQLHLPTTLSYSYFNSTVYSNMKYDGITSTLPLYSKIISEGIATIIFTGSFDGLDGVYGTQLWIQELPFIHNSTASEKSIYYTTKNSEQKVSGTYRTFSSTPTSSSSKTKTLSYLTVYNAGHVLGKTQFLVSKSLLSDLISSRRPTCHKPDQQCGTEGNVCGKMNGCNGRGECVGFRCHCEKGVYGADCSVVPKGLLGQVKIDSKEVKGFTLFPREWTYFSVSSGLGREVFVRVETDDNMEIHVYQRLGFAPSRSNFDSLQKGSKVVVFVDSNSEEEDGSEIILAVHNPNKSMIISAYISEMETLNPRIISR